MGFHHIVQSPLTLFDNLRLPAGTHICTASHAISKPRPTFQMPKTSTASATTRSVSNLTRSTGINTLSRIDHGHFGYGKFACPGRFSASSELKIIVAHLIMEYDFKYPEGKTRPEDLNVVEVLYPDPSARLVIKRRSKT